MRGFNGVLEHLKEAIEEITLGNFKKNALSENMELINDIGLDSLDYASAMLAGETYIGKKINENNVDWRDIKTLKQLAELLCKAQDE